MPEMGNQNGGLSPMDGQNDGLSPMDGQNGGLSPMDGQDGGLSPMDDQDGGLSPMDDQDGADMNSDDSSENGDSTMDIINQLSDTDKEAVRAYAQSMIDRQEPPLDSNNTDDGADNGAEGFNPQGGDAPMMESFVFTKAQLKQLTENFGPMEDELNKSIEDRKPASKKIEKATNRNTPFNSPKFN